MSGGEFFIGWAPRPPPRLGRFLAVVGAVLLAAFVLLGAGLGAVADDPAGRDFALVPGQPPFAFPDAEAFTGRLVARPYPHLVLADGRAVLLAGGGKEGLPGDSQALDGKMVHVAGFATARGSLAMLATDDPPQPVPDAAPLPAAPVQALGRWRITGEICDGKCAAGAMRPGTGLSHRACATLCIAGQVPPVFVSTGPVAGSAFLLLAGPDGGPMAEALRPAIGLRIRLEGLVERHGDMLVFRADPGSLAWR